jgi:hypothetical protein
MTDEIESLQKTFAGGVPDDDELWGDLRWEDLRDEGRDTPMPKNSRLERAVHERTGTCVEIYGPSTDGGYSVQAKLGGYDEDAVFQPDRQMVSATASVLEMNNPILGVARTIAFSWLRGWAHRNNTYHDKGFRDLERSDDEHPSADF